MKKPIVTIFAGLLVASLAACAAGSAPAHERQLKDMTSPDDALIFGSVAAVEGNQLTLNISKTPQYYLEGENPGESNAGQPSPEIVFLEDTEKDEAETGHGDVPSPSDEASIKLPNIDFEYTGESRTLTIPDDLDIGDMLGNEYRLNELKEGDRLLISLKSDGETYAFILVLPAE